VFWRTVNVQATTFTFFAGATFFVLYGSYVAVKPPRLGELTRVPILINGQPIKLPVEPVLRTIVIVGALVVAALTGAGMMSGRTPFALYWHGRTAAAAVPSAQLADPIFGRSLPFYLFTLPIWQLVSGWLLTLGVLVCAIAGFFVVISGGTRILTRG